MDVVKEWILTIVVCAVIIEIMNILMPEGSTRKTAAIICGIVMSLCIIMPAAKIYDNIKQFSFNYNESRSSIVENRDTYTEDQMLKVTSDFKQKLIKHVEDIVLGTDEITSCQAEVIIDEDYNSEKYGTVQRIYITAEAVKSENEDQQNNSGFLQFGKIERIDISIDGIKIIERDDKNEEKEDERVKKISELICNEFQISEENVFVEVQDEKIAD